MIKSLNDLKPFDASEYLETADECRFYIAEAMKTGDAGFIAKSIGVVAKARGMTDLAKQTGLSRETLYRTLGEKGNPNLKTLLSVMGALGLSLSVEPAEEAKVA